jgi:hypothetical protein
VKVIQQVSEPQQESRTDRREAQVERDEPDRVVEPDCSEDVTVLEDHSRGEGDPDSDDDTYLTRKTGREGGELSVMYGKLS